jgi:tetratricopeptide (TPR) repeat protein
VVYGDLMRDLGNLDKAMSEYNEAIKANGLNAAAHYDLGAVLLTKGDGDKASAEFTAALGVQQSYPDAHIQLGNIKFAKHDIENSLEEYAQALVQMKGAGAPRERIDALLEDVNQKLIKEKKKDTAKLWMDQVRQLVR